jgi:uncharacterized phage-associated protein
MSAMRLQKLVYYCQAWHLVWADRPLFQAEIQAWANGPVSPALWREHRGQLRVSTWPKGDASRLDDEEQENAGIVLEYYGDKNAQWLSDLTHMERPWRETRKGLPDGVASDRVIPVALIQEYYSSLPPG